MATYAGKRARVQVNGSNLCATKWSVTNKVDELDVTCFEGNGFAAYDAGVYDADITFDAFWEYNVHAAPPLLVAGANAVIRLYIDYGALAGTYFNFPTALLTNVTVDAEVRGMVKYSVTAKAHGTYTYPA